MNLKYLFIILTAVNLSAQQISRTIFTEKEQPISDARIGIENEDMGDITGKDGKYLIDLTNVDKNRIIKIDVNGYQPFRMKVSDFEVLHHYNLLLRKRRLKLKMSKLFPKNIFRKILEREIRKEPIADTILMTGRRFSESTL